MLPLPMEYRIVMNVISSWEQQVNDTIHIIHVQSRSQKEDNVNRLTA